MFFKAGQILALQRILNETRAGKGAWVLQRLEEALANRHKANAAAEEAQVWFCGFVFWKLIGRSPSREFSNIPYSI